jgi:hypothetical protein
MVYTSAVLTYGVSTVEGSILGEGPIGVCVRSPFSTEKGSSRTVSP